MSAEEDRLEVRTGFGSVKASGNLVVLLIVIVLCSGGVAYMVRDHDMRQTALTAAARVERMAQFQEMEMNQRALKDSIDENTYVQTLTSDERKGLHMDMPASLWAKTHR